MRFYYFFKFITKIIILGFFLTILGCASKKKDITEETVFEPDPQKRAREFADKGGGLFGDINNKKKSSNVVDFSTSNIMWRATLKSLDFLPLLNADYNGGIIIYDWYSDQSNSNEQIKISIRFLSNELRSDSLSISAHKKICENFDKCKTVKLDKKFEDQIRNNILDVSRTLKIEESKKNKN
jgi:hypothetical protein